MRKTTFQNKTKKKGEKTKTGKKTKVLTTTRITYIYGQGHPNNPSWLESWQKTKMGNIHFNEFFFFSTPTLLTFLPVALYRSVTYSQQWGRGKIKSEKVLQLKIDNTEWTLVHKCTKFTASFMQTTSFSNDSEIFRASSENRIKVPKCTLLSL